MRDTIQQNKRLLLTIGVCVIVFISGIGLGMTLTDPTESNSPNTTEAVQFNGTELVTSHQTTLKETQPYTITLSSTTTPSKNATLLPLSYEHTQVQENSTLITMGIQNDTTEIWATDNQTLLYNSETENVSTTTMTNLETRETQYLFLQQLFNSGEFKYTNVSVTGETTFEMTNLTDKDSLLYAYPTLSGQYSGTVTNVTVTGTVKNGIITNLTGSFDFRPQPEELENRTETEETREFDQQRYSFEMTVNTTVEGQLTPDWVQQYNENHDEESQNSTTTETTNSSES